LAHLAQLLAIFRQGCAAPSPLLVEPAWKYVQQQENDRAQTPPIQAVHRKLKDDMDKGYEPELTLLYGDGDPAVMLGPEFERLCRDFFSPIFAAAAGQGWPSVARATDGERATGRQTP
jgi:exonuclease V gamma subunit